MTEKWTLHTGDCLEVMRTLAPDSVDAIVTDPPYGLEFMGKDWDSFRAEHAHANPNRSGAGLPRFGSYAPYASDAAIAKLAQHRRSFGEWCEVWATEALRVAKPGAHILAFGGTRTHHRLMCALEDAGWEIRDTLMWMYGCLSDDTEILVDGEWCHYSKAMTGSLSLCYDVVSGGFAWLPIEDRYVYDYDDTAYRIQSAATDQIVSRNHRCVVESNGRWEFVVAEEAAREQEIRVPILEDMLGLLDAIRLPDSVSGTAKSVVHNVREEAYCSTETPQGDGRQGDDRDHVRSMRPEGVAYECPFTEGDITDMLSPLQRKATQSRPSEALTPGSIWMDGGIVSRVCAENDRREQPGMEGWCDVQTEQGELHRAEIREVPVSVRGYGSEGRVRHGASFGGSDGAGALPDANGSCSSQGPRYEEQRGDESSAVCNEPGSQKVRGARFTVAHMATVTPFHLRGVVWCVKVPTGAFVARRNGKVFVTGNSGFPKSLDVSMALDRHAGDPRNVQGTGASVDRIALDYGGATGKAKNGLKASFVRDDEPRTDLARQWEGWGTAIKPAYEPIVLARKPLVGTVAANVTKHGVGGLNIDGCRIHSGPSVGGSISGASALGQGSGWNEHTNRTTEIDRSMANGRWPANVILDEEAGALLDAQTGNLAPGASPAKKGLGSARVFGDQPRAGVQKDREQLDGGGASRFFYCAKTSKSERNGGVENNNHPTVKPIALMQYLVRLVTPPNGLVLDPFNGSGTTGCATVLEGFRYLGIEQSPEYVAIAEKRIAHWEAQKELPAKKQAKPKAEKQAKPKPQKKVVAQPDANDLDLPDL